MYYNLTWEDLTFDEQEQVRESYICFRECEEERSRDEVTDAYPEPINGDNVRGYAFHRTEDGYIEISF